MITFVARRMLQFIPVLLGVLLVVFLVLRLIPGDPAAVLLGTEGSAAERQRLEVVLGLDQPLYVQFVRYVERTLSGDLGRSIFQGVDVSKLILEALPATIELALLALAIVVIVAIPLGIWAAIRAKSWVDVTITVITLLGVSMPLVWVGILLILLFSQQLGWLPPFGQGPSLASGLQAVFRGQVAPLAQGLRYAILPAVTLAFGSIAIVVRLTRSSMLEVLQLDYVRTARAKGAADRTVILKHAFRNALLPIVTIIGLQLGALLGGAIITETIFAWPGIGRLIVTAINQRDYPVVQGSVVFVAIFVSLINLLVDISYGYINPKIRYS
ncbi:ABC transporter permease (plasmid) [Deinococcus metallilatus]|uniref:ABC transporter permease n=1 Tax=Deinococcus metallilatus TaxID=1211322 RepID=A0AAJ5FCC9_9DEIO|nr:ABC transporter permease [Deinococcus metallilatus]MBB5295718.1 peptide/nickel transport system permease protein [Deinococcus metallilatus]QBY06834.1 ABC transporter permease [Deinococcus metallilatus]TLK32223.1 ABC transporter permease [Deinococcus metallilatus]GMA14249.1 peptide ABC transporter permease [Deinococcus metallilatus]